MVYIANAVVTELQRARDVLEKHFKNSSLFTEIGVRSIDGRSIIKEFGNIKPGLAVEGRPPLNLHDQREPLIDIIEDDDELKVVAELPGVEKKDIQLFATERTLTINVDAPESTYYKELDLPVGVDESSARSKYRNGVLEIVFKKKDRGRGTQFNIERPL